MWILLCLLLMTSCSGDAQAIDTNTNNNNPTPPVVKPEQVKYYSNPVWKNSSCADPSVLKYGDYFYCYSTDNNCNVLRSADLVNWEKVGTAFTQQTRPAWILKEDGTKPYIWAPCCIYRKGVFYLYYSVSAGIGLNKSGFGVATSNKPEGPFTDHGPIVQVGDGCGTNGNIDAFFWEENGTPYIIWGSYSGIFISELTPDGLSLKYPKSPRGITQIATTAWEGPYIYKKNGYYYFFGSNGTCCKGDESTYNVQVARATSLMGPYKNKKGENILDVKGSYKMLVPNDYAVGAGHNAEIMVDDAGDEWFIYHSYIRGHADEYKRVLFIDKITWDEYQWPVLNDGKGPSSTAKAPVFR